MLASRSLGIPAVALALVAVIAGCGSSATKLSPKRQAEMRLERTDLVLASRQLERLEQPLRTEVRASRAAWPLIEKGLVGTITAQTVGSVASATERAEAIVAPPQFRPEAFALTGPASAIAGLFEDFSALAVRGWRLTRQAVDGARRRSATRFLRSNAGLYIDCVYDGHFDLGLVGKSLTKSYLKLGGPMAFGDRLTQARVNRIAAVYSPAEFDLAHPSGTLAN